MALANGLAISSDREARRRWLSQRQSGPAQTQEQFSATLGRLAAKFPGKVKIH